MGLQARCYIFVHVIFITFLSAALSVPAFAANKVIQHHNNVQINWTDQIITAKAVSMALTAKDGTPLDSNTMEVLSVNEARSRTIVTAKDKATEMLVNALQTIRIDPSMTFGHSVQLSDYTQMQLGLIMDHITFRFRPQGAAATLCTATLPIGRLLTLLPESLPSKDIPTLPVALPATDYTGLIVDTRGLHSTPILFPSLFMEDGTEFFGKDFIDSRDAFVYGIAAYSYTDDTALQHKKAGRQPYYCAALRLLNGSPVIANADLKKILASAVTRNNLKKGNIVIIIDRE